MKVNVKKLNENAKLPVYGSEYAAGADLYAAEGDVIPAGETRLIHTGIAVESCMQEAGSRRSRIWRPPTKWA